MVLNVHTYVMQSAFEERNMTKPNDMSMRANESETPIKDSSSIIPAQQQQTSFHWSSKPEPHAGRKKEMLEKYGNEIRALMGHEPLTKYLLTPVVLMHIYVSTFAASMSTTAFLLTAYFIGGTFVHLLVLGIHEVTHYLAFKSYILNDFYAMFVGLPLVIPMAISFKQHHSEHHRYQGHDHIDVDVPTEVEAQFFSGRLGKVAFVLTQIVWYAVRPDVVRGLTITPMFVLNWLIQLSFNYLLFYFMGPWPFLYSLLSIYFAGTIHPIAGHFLSEHYVFDPNKVQETYSYYGPLNVLAWNVGYHNEHHDFPNIPWTRLPKLRALAPEFYEGLVQTSSWPMTLVDFILDNRMSLYSRVTRERGAWKLSH